MSVFPPILGCQSQRLAGLVEIVWNFWKILEDSQEMFLKVSWMRGSWPFLKMVCEILSRQRYAVSIKEERRNGEKMTEEGKKSE